MFGKVGENNNMNLPSVERRIGNMLPRMTARQKQTATRLIREICGNHDNGNCLLLADVCPQCITHSVVCKYFRWVLLEDIAGLSLKSQLFWYDTMKRCMICKGVYQSKSNNAKYCAICAANVHRRRKAIFARKRRAGVDK